MSIWTKISEECFQNLVESMPQRIKAVLKAKGGPTRYQQGVPNNVASECIYINKVYLFFHAHDLTNNLGSCPKIGLTSLYIHESDLRSAMEGKVFSNQRKGLVPLTPPAHKQTHTHTHTPVMSLAICHVWRSIISAINISCLFQMIRIALIIPLPWDSTVTHFARQHNTSPHTLQRVILPNRSLIHIPAMHFDTLQHFESTCM